jgi:hypothetical protein
MVAKKPADERRRRNQPATKAELPESPPVSAAPPLPEAYTVSDGANELRIDWLPETRQWYANWASAPQAAQFLPTDWDYLRLVVAPLFDRWLRGGSKEIASELRLQLREFGGSPGARNTLGWKVKADQQPKPAEAGGEGGRYGHLRPVAGGKST